MKYRIVRWNYNKNALHLDRIDNEQMYKRRIGNNRWLQLLNENEELHLKEDITYDSILDAEEAFNKILLKNDLPVWDNIWKSKVSKWFHNYDWDRKLEIEFDNISYQSIKKLMTDVYELALEDANCEQKYTYLVLHNLQLIANDGIESITFRQWKSFRAYVNSNIKKENKDIQKFLK